MQRWEYRVISLRNGTYTATLNEYGREGWELVSVTPQPQDAPPPAAPRSVPIPGALGRIGDAATKVSQFGADAPAEETSSLLWVLRRPLPLDERDAD